MKSVQYLDTAGPPDSPLALPQCPAGDDPEGDHEDEEDGAGADRHQGFQDKSGVEVDPVESPDTPGAGVSEELAVEQHHPADQVQPGGVTGVSRAVGAISSPGHCLHLDTGH